MVVFLKKKKKQKNPEQKKRAGLLLVVPRNSAVSGRKPDRRNDRTIEDRLVAQE
jgi:hypothetical protein